MLAFNFSVHSTRSVEFAQEVKILSGFPAYTESKKIDPKLLECPNPKAYLVGNISAGSSFPSSIRPRGKKILWYSTNHSG